MSEEFHEISLKSILFKGRSDIYFCYLKSEKIAHVLAVLANTSPLKDTQNFDDLVSLAARLPHAILHFVAGEIEPSVLLADIFSLLTSVRLSATQGYIRKENTLIIVQEYENIARKIAAENHPSPFVSSKDFSVEEVNALPASKPFFNDLFSLSGSGESAKKVIKDIHKGQEEKSKKQSSRMSLILDFVRKNNGVSIKDIAKVIKGCSEKTIQRELGDLIEQGLIERKGERRWSTYTAVPPTS
jgi:predicted transcriptional regulator